jgi:biotin transport system permease protein
VLDARRARGAQGSLLALAVPVVVRSLYAADAIGEALAARGLDD